MRPTSPDRGAPGRVFGRQARHPSERRTGIRTAVLYGTFAGLVGTNVLTLVALLMAPDIAGLLDRQNELVFAAYEDRIAHLRIEVDRLHSRQFAQAGDLNLQLQELTQQQEMLMEQHHYVRLLAEKAAELGIQAAIPPTGQAPTLVSSAIPSPAAETPLGRIEQAERTLHDMMSDSRLALTALSEGAETATRTILAELAGIGIRPVVPEHEAMGGPFLPARDDLEEASLVDDANSVLQALNRLEAARSALESAPVHRPIAGSARMSSNFGNRRDPFTGRRAFHAGIDFPSPTGTTVTAAGGGKVTFAGRKSGYGNVVEISHPDGLMTRYAHLSAIMVKKGENVAAGSTIARVGSTGRSTGPHLHFEVRRAGEPLDPTRYLSAGKRLVRFM